MESCGDSQAYIAKQITEIDGKNQNCRNLLTSLVSIAEKLIENFLFCERSGTATDNRLTSSFSSSKNAFPEDFFSVHDSSK